MRKYLIAGNWKMNLDRSASVQLAGDLAAGYPAAGETQIAVCPPSVYLDAVGQAIRDCGIALGAQNMYATGPGAYTGEVCADMLLDLGCRYVILGHSERRGLMGETNAMVNEKTHAALAAGLIPIVCVGESLEQREAGQTSDVVRSQFEQSLAGLNEAQVAGLVIAYEPVWAIGTGKVATPEQAEEVHADLRNLLAGRYNSGLAEQVQILYGGSVKPDNAGDLLSQANVDGALVGGASLKLDSFSGIIEAASQIAVN